MSLPEPFEITPGEVKRRSEAGERLQLIDVREPAEFALAALAGAELIPMNQIPASLPHLEERAAEGPLIIFCHHGVRSLNVVTWLRRQGIEDCLSMAGGIERWSVEIDSSVPRY
jgi:rhodanese-related sulfurtransferase